MQTTLLTAGIRAWSMLSGLLIVVVVSDQLSPTEQGFFLHFKALLQYTSSLT